MTGEHPAIHRTSSPSPTWGRGPGERVSVLITASIGFLRPLSNLKSSIPVPLRCNNENLRLCLPTITPRSCPPIVTDELNVPRL